MSEGFETLHTSEYDGVKSRSFALPRPRLVSELFTKIFEGNNRCIYLGAPAASGKTTLLQLFKEYCNEQGVTCIYQSMLKKNYKTLLHHNTGIDANTWCLELDNNGRCVCADSTKQFVVMLDDAQKQYDDPDLWSDLIKSDVSGFQTLPNNIRFIISATYSLDTPGSPISFATLPKLNQNKFRLDNDEVDELFNLYIARYKDETATPFLHDLVVRNMITGHCNGHIGSLSISINEIIKHFHHNSAVNVESIEDFYFSAVMTDQFGRCFRSGLTSIPDNLRECLIHMLTIGRYRVPGESPEYRQLIRSGILEETRRFEAKFTSPAAAQYINELLFPNRSLSSIEDVKKRGLFALLKSVVSRMSATTLRQSVVDLSSVPSEATFQHLMFAGLEAETPADCNVISEISKYFPETSTDVPNMKNAPNLPTIKGRCDFFLNGELRWAIEALIQNSKLNEHLSRFNDRGKYVGLKYKNYAVINFVVTANGELKNVRKGNHLMTVVFKKGDFSFCNLFCKQKPVERLTLAK